MFAADTLTIICSFMNIRGISNLLSVCKCLHNHGLKNQIVIEKLSLKYINYDIVIKMRKIKRFNMVDNIIMQRGLISHIDDFGPVLLYLHVEKIFAAYIDHNLYGHILLRYEERRVGKGATYAYVLDK